MQSHAGGCGGSPAPVCRYIPSSCSWKASSKRMCRFVRRNPKSARTRFRRFMINCSLFDSSTRGFQRSMRAPRGGHEIMPLAFCRSCRVTDRNHWDINVIGALGSCSVPRERVPLGPRALFALTHVAAAAVSALVTYALMAHDPTQNDTTADGRAASSMVAHVGYPRDPASTETAAPSAGASPELRADVEPELSAGAGAAEQTDAGAGPSAAGRDDTGGEQARFDLGSTAFQSGYYE